VFETGVVVAEARGGGPASLVGAHSTGPDERALVLDALEHASGAVRDVLDRAQDARRWDGTTRARALRLLDRLAALVTAARAPLLVAQHDAAGEVCGERSFVDTRARLAGTSRAAVTRELDAARALRTLPEVAQAVGEHTVPVAHVDVLGRALATVPAAAPVLARPETQRALVELARQTGAREFARSVDALVAEHAPDAVADAREAARRARFLTLTHAGDGTYLRGRLDPLAGQALARALDATGHRADEDRTGDQARADALTALAQHALTAGMPATARPAPRDAGRPSDTAERSEHETCGHEAVPWQAVVPNDDERLPDGAASAPSAHVSLLVPAETWVAVRSAARRRRERAAVPLVTHDDGRRGAAPDVPERRPASARAAPAASPPPAVSDDGVVLTPTELAAALCDCAMTRVVMDAAGLPLDVGRSRRMFTPAQRLAVVARDRQCAWNGCSTPARYGQVHHVRWWHRDGGPSDLENAVLLCGFHHHEVHRLDLDVRRLPLSRGDGEGQAPPGGPLTGDLPVRYEFVDRAARVVNGPRHPG